MENITLQQIAYSIIDIRATLQVIVKNQCELLAIAKNLDYDDVVADVHKEIEEKLIAIIEATPDIPKE